MVKSGFKFGKFFQKKTNFCDKNFFLYSIHTKKHVGELSQGIHLHFHFCARRVSYEWAQLFIKHYFNAFEFLLSLFILSVALKKAGVKITLRKKTRRHYRVKKREISRRRRRICVCRLHMYIV